MSESLIRKIFKCGVAEALLTLYTKPVKTSELCKNPLIAKRIKMLKDAKLIEEIEINGVEFLRLTDWGEKLIELVLKIEGATSKRKRVKKHELKISPELIDPFP